MVLAHADGSTPSLIILVVEDEELIRQVAVEVLTEEGWLALEAEHADAALRLLEAHAEDIHVVFTDVQMPGSLDGVALAHHVHHHWPKLHLIVTSGRPLPRRAHMPPGCRLLRKPYPLRQVVGLVRELAATA
jgi:CheY-like chemotaxis protein